MSDDKHISDTLAALRIEVAAQFVPFSQSRNRDEKIPSLNWCATLRVAGRDVLTTEYMTGVGHCPSYSLDYGTRQGHEKTVCCARECETGIAHSWSASWQREPKPVFIRDDKQGTRRAKRIELDPVAFVHSIVMDSEAIDYAGFEDWADCYGYDRDSRKVYAIYTTCVDIGLKLRAVIGDAGIATLRDVYSDY